MKNFKNDYRALWQYITKMNIPNNYVIHHLNFNHKDSRVGNIIALPDKIHKQFHCIVHYSKNNEDMYNKIMLLKFDNSYIRYMKQIDKHLNEKVIKGILLRSIGIKTTLDCIKSEFHFNT